jgi:hypothetical protein
MSAEISTTPIVLAGPPRPSRRARGDGRQSRFGHGALSDAKAVYDYAIELMAAVEHEIGDLWRDTIDCGDPHLSDSLVDLSHAVRRAALAFEHRSVGA